MKSPVSTWQRRPLLRALAALSLVGTAPLAMASWRTASDAERAAHGRAFAALAGSIPRDFPDVRSVVVALQGRPAFEYHRGGNADELHDIQSVAKTALAILIGVALQEGRLPGLDVPVLELLPDWRGLNPDPRAATVTLRHLLTMTAGFAIDDPTGTAAAVPPRTAWSRAFAATPGTAFAYDNAVVPLVSAVLAQATGVPVADYARSRLVEPLGMTPPSFERGVRMRTRDMAAMGQLLLQQGAWGGRQLLPAAFVAEATRAHTRGGPPAGLPYGYLCWVTSMAERPDTYFASGWGGQMVWVHAPLGMVAAVTADATPGSQQRGQAVRLVRGPLFAAAREVG